MLGSKMIKTTVYFIIYAHGFVLCLVVVIPKFATVIYPNTWSIIETSTKNVDKTYLCITTAKDSSARTRCIFLIADVSQIYFYVSIYTDMSVKL